MRPVAETLEGRGQQLNHFSDEAWVDFVRQVPTSARTNIQRHLDEGCAECVRSHGVWRAIAETMTRDQQYEAPEGTTLAGIRLFGDWRREFIIPKRARIARLIYDSFREPLPAGVRGGANPERRLLHRRGPWSIDTRIEVERRGRVLLDGQLLREKQPDIVNKKIEVFLTSGDKVLTSAFLNQFGEFQLLCYAAPDLRAYFDIPDEVPIQVKLPDPAEQSRTGAITPLPVISD